VNLRPLGRTGLHVSEVVFGGYPVRDPDVVRAAIDRGITAFDTAFCYTRGVSEEAIGRGIEGRRDRVVLTTKWHPWARTRADEMLAELETSLRRLRTDHVDVLLVHQVGRNSGGEGPERLDNPELQKAMDAARRAGKARFFGCSGHDLDLEAVLAHAVEIPGFSVVLCRYDPARFAGQRALLRRLRDAGFGLFVMKVLSGARGADLTPFRESSPSSTSKQAALRWALSNEDLSGVAISMGSRDQVEEYVRAVERPGASS
jgi:aryl-alcohol dehydrogenase-like predicted oxidoreductase